ncbi:hypothetical protein ENTCAN_06316 [Enterobacter cancerogenus ATCC 35316]|nr:hypothetical protein ENTCAN_06316 [Enterobacter cancerogenus ATCC 35316]
MSAVSFSGRPAFFSPVARRKIIFFSDYFPAHPPKPARIIYSKRAPTYSVT